MKSKQLLLATLLCAPFFMVSGCDSPDSSVDQAVDNAADTAEKAVEGATDSTEKTTD